MEKYKLYYKELLIGTVTKTEEDLPDYYGDIVIEEGNLTDAIRDYIEYSRTCNRLFQEDEGDFDSFVDENEIHHKDIIEGGNWFLEDEAGRKTGIEVPLFSEEWISWCQENS